MNSSEYKAFYDQVGKINGWDFSRVKCVLEADRFLQKTGIADG